MINIDHSTQEYAKCIVWKLGHFVKYILSTRFLANIIHYSSTQYSRIARRYGNIFDQTSQLHLGYFCKERSICRLVVISGKLIFNVVVCAVMYLCRCYEGIYICTIFLALKKYDKMIYWDLLKSLQSCKRTLHNR